jgi:uncharacterized protein (DUF2164 family)
MWITLSKDFKLKLIASVQHYVSENLETEFGELQASLSCNFTW